jgi:acetoin utilization protein AcuB
VDQVAGGRLRRLGTAPALLGFTMTNKQLAGVRVGRHMSAAPLTLGADQTLSVAHRLMRERRIRHLPVLRGGKLVGLLSQRDLMLIETLPDVDPATVPVEDAITTDVFAVSPETPVAARMAECKLGSAVVMEQDRVVGVFTATDACRTLARFLSPSTPRSAGRKAAAGRKNSRASRSMPGPRTRSWTRG